MAPQLITPEGFLKLKDLAAWMKTAQMEQQGKNIFRCVDGLREKMLRPLLTNLKLENRAGWQRRVPLRIAEDLTSHKGGGGLCPPQWHEFLS
jgi:hypothetical protein